MRTSVWGFFGLDEDTLFRPMFPISPHFLVRLYSKLQFRFKVIVKQRFLLLSELFVLPLIHLLNQLLA